MTYNVISKTDAARGKKYYLIEVSTERSVEFKLDDGATDSEITTVVDNFLAAETRIDEEHEKIQKAINEALLPSEAKTG